MPKIPRFLPLLLGLAVLALIYRFWPQPIKELLNVAELKLNFQQMPGPPPENFIESVNNFRQAHQAQALAHNEQLDEAARLLALSIVDAKGEESKVIPVKQAAGAVGYAYQTLAYLAAIDALPLVQPVTTTWIKTEDRDLLSSSFTQIGTAQTQLENRQIVTVVVLASPQKPNPSVTPTPTIRQTQSINYTGVQLWAEIQRYRREHGVPEFKQDNVLCTLASIRVTHLVTLGKLDDHQGFSPLVDEYRKNGQLTFGNLAENILMGYLTPAAAVAGWDGSLGHQALMKDGSYVWGCAAANSGFGVLIAAY